MKKIKLKYNEILDIIIWSFFFYFNNLYFVGYTQISFLFILSFISVVALIIYRTKNKKKYFNVKTNKKLVALWILFTISIIATDIINDENLFYLVILCTVIPYLFMFKINFYKGIEGIILKSILFSSFLIVLNISGLLNLNSIYLFLKSNSTGLFLIFFSIYSLYKFYFNAYYSVLVLFNFILLLFSSSRTSLISFVILLLIIISAKFWKDTVVKKIITLYFIIFLGLILILSIHTFKSEIMEIDLVQKFMIYSSAGDNFNGRSQIWNYILENANFVGHNIEILYEQFNLSPHNNFLGILYSNGIFAFLFFVLVNLFMIFKMFLNLFNNEYSVFGSLVIMFIFFRV